MKIEDLDISTRSYHLLCRNGINTVDDLFLARNNLDKIKGLGSVSYKEIIDAMSKIPENLRPKNPRPEEPQDAIPQNQMQELIEELRETNGLLKDIAGRIATAENHLAYRVDIIGNDFKAICRALKSCPID